MIAASNREGPVMRRVVCVLLLPMMAAVATARAQAGPGRVGIRLSCDGPETALVSMIAYERDRGTPKAEMIARAERLPENDGSRGVAVSRVDDVYLDPALQPATLSAFRSKKCQLGLLLRDLAPHADHTRERLLQCQAIGTGGRGFRNCIHALIGELEDRLAKADAG
jgi:hypothetical protein